MQIYLMRHGAAGPALPGMPDSTRSLTPEGKTQVHFIGTRLARILGSPDIFASPYERAQQTAAIMAEAIGSTAPIITCAELTPERTPREAWNEIRNHVNGRPLLLVGHEPLFSTLTAFLLGFPELAIEFSTATIACLEVNDARQPRGTLKWLINPLVAAD